MYLLIVNATLGSNNGSMPYNTAYTASLCEFTHIVNATFVHTQNQTHFSTIK